MLVEYAHSPLAIGVRKPRFSWEVPLTGRNRRQTAYRILVASSKDRLEPGRADLWDSGKVESAQSVHVEYAGAGLRSNMDCYWTVQIWDEAGLPGEFSPPACFGTALFDESDWHAAWIGMGPAEDPRDLAPPGSEVVDPRDLVSRVNEVEGKAAATSAFHSTFPSTDTRSVGGHGLRDLASTDTRSVGGRDPRDRASTGTGPVDVEPEPRAPLLRKEFSLDNPVKRARAFVCGLGLFELRLNGAKVGEDVLATPRTEFRKRVFYFAYDITAALKSGANVVGMMLGNGWFNAQKKHWHWQAPWYGSPRAIVQLEIDFADGSRSRVVSDDSWQGTWSPITFNCIYDGEDYDARLEQAGWDAPGFDAAGWQAVTLVSPSVPRLPPSPNDGETRRRVAGDSQAAAPEIRRVVAASVLGEQPGCQVGSPVGILVAMDHEPGRVMRRFPPVAVREPKPGVFVYDLGTVMTGWARLRIPQGVRGETVTLRYAELMKADGMIDPSTAGGARQADVYVMKGEAGESYEPRFTYHGFRYVELTGFPGTPRLDALEGCFVHAGVAPAGTFECGNELINKIHQCTLQSQRCNLQMGVPTDDTQREERLGWCGDAWSYAVESFYNLDTARFWSKWIADFYDQQDEELGVVGYICPLPGLAEDLVWSAAFVLIPWWHYLHYGDRRILEASYPYLKKYIAYLERVGRKEIPPLPPGQVAGALLPVCGRKDRFPAPGAHGYLQRSLFGDHLATHEGSSGFCKDHPRSMATAFYYQDVATMARIAEVLGQGDDARGYRALAERIKQAYNDCFFDVNLGYYDIGCQSAQAFAVAFGLVPPEHLARVSGYLNSSVNFRQRRITSGYAGTKWVIDAIAQSGRNDILWNRAIATDYPSWGYMLRDGKTTITENWAGAASQCHTTLGAAIDEWFYWGLAGIQPDASGPGFEKIVFKPYFPAGLPWVNASLQTPRGVVVSKWRQDSTAVTLEIAVPANSTAKVHLPVDDATGVTEQGVPVLKREDVRLIKEGRGETVFSVGSGSYQFRF